MSESIRIVRTDVGLELHYYPDVPIDWLPEKLRHEDSFVLGRVFYYNRSELGESLLRQFAEDIESVDIPIKLPFANTEGDYYVVSGERLGIDQNVYFEKNITQTIKNFRATRQVSVFKQIASLTNEPIYIGGSEITAIPASEFLKIVRAIPSEYELRKYVSARISAVLRNYIDTSDDAVRSYQRYIDSRPARIAANVRREFAEYEVDKYEKIHSRLSQMLRDENEYSESTWQEGIKDILLLVFPQYLRAFREAPIFDGRKNKIRSVDFLLVDASGTVDLLEIKKPFNMAVVTAGTYRDNHIPLRDLSGSVMQLEKYLYNLVRSGAVGEKRLNDRFGRQLPDSISIKVTNPRGIVLIGRDNNLSQDQLFDFEVIRRKYKNVIDILTYDDLLRRVNATIYQLRGLQVSAE